MTMPMKPRRERNAVPLPPDAPLISFEEAAAYLRLSPVALRKIVDGRAEAKNDEFGTLVRGWVVRISPRRRYIHRNRFLGWLNDKADEASGVAG